jgi:hypothetical protein
LLDTYKCVHDFVRIPSIPRIASSAPTAEITIVVVYMTVYVEQLRTSGTAEYDKYQTCVHRVQFRTEAWPDCRESQRK